MTTFDTRKLAAAIELAQQDANDTGDTCYVVDDETRLSYSDSPMYLICHERQINGRKVVAKINPAR
jgi:hypothetical protein